MKLLNNFFGCLDNLLGLFRLLFFGFLGFYFIRIFTDNFVFQYKKIIQFKETLNLIMAAENGLFFNVVILFLSVYIFFVVYKISRPFLKRLFNQLIKTWFKYFYSFSGFVIGSIVSIFTYLFSFFYNKNLLTEVVLVGLTSIIYTELVSWVVLRKKQIVEESNGNKNVLSELPITCLEDDIYEIFKLPLLELKMKLKDPDTFRGRILPIYGDNGSGKTSLIKVLESELRENKEYKFVFFNVSNYRDETALIKAFFNTLFSNISQYGFFKNINDFENFLTKCFTIFDGKSVLFDFLKNLLTFSYNDSSLNSDKRDCVSEVVEDLNLKIIFVVDNIDRTSIKQRYLLIRMMHSISDIRGIVFLLPTSVSDLLNIGKPKLVSVVE